MTERLWDSRVLRLHVGVAAAVGLMVIAAALLRSEAFTAAARVVLLPMPLLTLYVCFRTSRHPGLSRPAVRFWQRYTLAMSFMTLAAVGNAVYAVAPSDAAGIAGRAMQVLGTVAVLWPMLGLSTEAGSRPQRVALWLDIATLVLGGTIVLWQVVVDRSPAAGLQGLPAVTVVTLASGVLGLFLLARIALGGSGMLSRRAQLATSVSATAGGLLPPVAILLFDLTRPGAPGQELLMLVPVVAGLALSFTARFFVVDGNAPRPSSSRRRRMRLAPYVAVIAVDAMLIQHVRSGGSGAMVVTAGAVLLTALVVVRQIVAAEENAGLVEELRREEERFRLLVQNSSDVVAITEANGRFRYVSPAVTRVLGLDPAAVVGTTMHAWAHPGDLEAMRAGWARTMSAPGASATYRARIRNAGGEFRWLEIITANLVHEPSIRGVLTNSRDVTETTQVQDRLSHEATHDGLTGLANRVLFTDRVTAATTREGATFSLVLVDLDDFKTVNDTLGHAAGDALLVAVAERMTASVRPTDTVARLGGDEFAIVVEGLRDEAVDKVLRRIAESLLVPVAVEDQLISVRASFGVADGHCGDDADELLRRADIAMYEAKARGEGGHVRFEAGMQARGAERNRLCTALRTAIDTDQLVLHYQPVVALPDGRLTGVEALVRWQHPERGLLAPGEFIAAAEESGLIVDLGGWVLRHATRQAAAWIAEFGDEAPGTVSVNVSAHQLREPALAAEVAAALRDSGLPAARLCVEITESTAVGGGATAQNLRALRDLGVRLSLDDFGTGAATLSLLATCPVDQIKLDRSFVGGPEAIPQAVVQLAHALGVEAVAEGIETAEQADRLSGLGYDRAQGFLYARPMPPTALADALRRPALTESPVA